MKIRTISDENGKVVAILGGGDSNKFRVRMRPKTGQYYHELELPAEAASLKPPEIHRRLKIPSPGEAPVFSME